MNDGEYDDTNRGVLFVPDDKIKLIGRGKVNVAGNEHQALMVRQQISRDGRVENVLYVKAAVMWGNDPAKMKENSPKWGGDLGPVSFPENHRVAGWSKKSQSGVPFVSLAVSEKQERDGGGDNGGYDGGGTAGWDSGTGGGLDDEIPF